VAIGAAGARGRAKPACFGAELLARPTQKPRNPWTQVPETRRRLLQPARLYEREDALLARLRAGEETDELRAELAAVREAIRRSLRQENHTSDEWMSGE
jgi:hypothetical protein